MGLLINSEISKQYLLEEDAIQGFKKAVDNNQIRLALQVLTEIVDAFMEAFEVLVEQEDTPVAEEVAPVEVKAEEPKKPTAKKAETKEEKTS